MTIPNPAASDEAKLSEDRKLIREALAYKSGPDSCNSVYMGSMATTMVYHALGLKYGAAGFDEALDRANREQLDAALKPCASVIEYMRANPMDWKVVSRKALALQLAEQRAEIERLRLELVATKPLYSQRKLEAQLAAANLKLASAREVIEQAESIFANCSVSAGVCCCGDNMENHSDPMHCGHSPVDMGQYNADQWVQAARAWREKESGK